MAQVGDSFDLGRLGLKSGEGHSVQLEVRLDPFELAGLSYQVGGGRVSLKLDCSHTTTGWALHLRFDAVIEGPCMRCLEAASPTVSVDTREVEQPGADEELHTPYLQEEVLDLRSWAHDALALALPQQVLCSSECKGLCGSCGANLNEEDPADHRHEGGGDSRWEKLREIRFD